MIKVMIIVFMVSFVYAAEWNIKRNPFVVSKNYMDRTGKHYLMPQDTYAYLDINVRGLFYRNGVRTALLDLGEKGFIYITEGEVIDIDTADIKSRLKAQRIEPSYILISINEGEAIRHDIK